MYGCCCIKLWMWGCDPKSYQICGSHLQAVPYCGRHLQAVPYCGRHLQAVPCCGRHLQAVPYLPSFTSGSFRHPKDPYILRPPLARSLVFMKSSLETYSMIIAKLGPWNKVKIKLLFDYNLLVLLLVHAYMIFPTTFSEKNRNLCLPALNIRESIVL